MNTIDNNRSRELELQNHKTEVENQQYELQQKENIIKNNNLSITEIKKQLDPLNNQIESLENQIASQLLKSEGFRNKDCCNHENLINFKLSIIKQQVLLLAAI